MAGAIANPMLPKLFQVNKVRRETHDTVTLFLEPEGPIEEFHFEAGQFNMVYVYGIGEVPLSISGDPAHPETLIHTVRSVGKVTEAMCDLHQGDVVGVRGPYGSHWPVEKLEGYDIVVVAGGVGLAPLRSAIYQVLANRERYGHVCILYGARTPRDLLYLGELEKWRGRFDVQVEVSVDSAGRDWRGDVGVITTLIPRAVFDPLHAAALVCGPEVMMRFSVLELEKRGIPLNSIFLSMERNMQCGLGQCGHCQYGPLFICQDGPVFSFEALKNWFGKREI